MEAAIVTNTGEHFAFARDLRMGDTVFMSSHFIPVVSTFQRGDLIEWERDGRYHPRPGQVPYRASTARVAGLGLGGQSTSNRFVDPVYGRKYPVLPEILDRFPGVVPFGFRGRFAVVEGTARALKGAFAEVPLVNWETGEATSFFVVVSHPRRDGEMAILDLEGNLWGRDAIQRNKYMKLVSGRPSVGEQIGQREELVWQ